MRGGGGMQRGQLTKKRRGGTWGGSEGALDGGSPCRLSNLRNANVACLCRLFMAMSHVEFKK